MKTETFKDPPDNDFIIKQVTFSGAEIDAMAALAIQAANQKFGNLEFMMAAPLFDTPEKTYRARFRNYSQNSAAAPGPARTAPPAAGDAKTPNAAAAAPGTAPGTAPPG